MPRETARLVATVVAVAAIYFLAARFGFWLAAVAYKNVSTVWPPTGIALAALYLFGPRLWPGVALGAFLANATTGLPVAVAAGIAAGNTLEALVGTHLLRRLGFDPALARVGDVVRLVGLAAIGATVVSATIGVACLAAGGFVAPEAAWAAWRTWWIGDLMGALLVVPVALALRPGGPGVAAWLRGHDPRRLLEALGVTGALAGMSWYVFFQGEPGGFAHPYFVFPPLIWAATRFGPRGAAFASLLVSAIAIAGTDLGHGPFARDDLNRAFSLLQTFMALQTVTVLVLAAAIAEARRAAETRRQLEALREVDTLKDQFMSILSHELRTPLNAIVGYTSMLRDHEAGPLNDEQEQCLDRVLKSSDTLLGLIDDLLDLTRIRAGKFTIKVAPTDLREVLDEAGNALRALAERKRLTLTIVAPEGLPPVPADGARVGQVLTNLIGNAIKFTKEGGTVAVSCRLAGDRVRCEVADTGIGIARADLAKLFKQFGQVDTSHTRAAGGTGLGLSISKGIVEAHGGTIGVESEPGEGSTFWFELPVSAASR